MKVLLVGHNAEVTASLVSMLTEGCDQVEIAQAARLQEVLEFIDTEGLDVVLMELDRPSSDGLETLTRVREHAPELAVVVIAAEDDPALADSVLRAGAQDYLLRGRLTPETLNSALRHAVARHRVVMELQMQNLRQLEREEQEARLQERNHVLTEMIGEALHALGAALDLRDTETKEHAERVVEYTVNTALEMGVRGKELLDMQWGAMLHDIGKIGIPDGVLFKPRKLSAPEWGVMRDHPEVGGSMVQSIPFLDGALPLIVQHHERYDGSGYPRGLTGEEIALGARIFAVADSFDAMTTDRPYRVKRSSEEALAELQRCAGTHFDANVVDAFVRWYLRDGATRSSLTSRIASSVLLELAANRSQ